ncbi:unnamed protein product [Rotaria sordida]|uniref:HAT C-terminal dimerisation domain-containing protein n=1 Tax=Rotaria sordida TaxID=392033 RepID=A0A814Y9T8_9BILA|nr:unnamed protein product [Rotaria sordida]CAF1507975.1 unnamed protein product [Rotaria sordida]
MSKQSSLDKYFGKRKENNDVDKSAKRNRIENENIITQSNAIANDPCDLINDSTTTDIQSIEDNSIISSISISNNIGKRSYKSSCTQKFPWLLYESNTGGFCQICRNYWKPSTPLFRDMEQKTKGVFTSTPFTNRKKALGDNGKLMKHSRSSYHLMAIDNDIFRQREGSVLNQIVCDAESIFNSIITDLQKKSIDLNKIRFVSFDGVAVFSGIHNGVAARFRAAFNIAILFIYCRAHLLQLAVISAAEDSPDISRSLSALKSLVNFINRSSVRLSSFENIQDIFRNQHIKLIQPGDTRWLSNSLAIRSLLQSYQLLLITLESIYNENNEDSAEALGLYNILSNEGTAFILHALQPILDTLAILSKSIQTKAADFKQLQDFLTSTLLRLEQLKDYTSDDYVAIIETIQKLSLTSSTIRISRSSISNLELNISEVFSTKVLPFIENVINNIQTRFEHSTLNLLNCFMIFDMENLNDNKDYGDEEIRAIQQHYASDIDESVIYEWKTFRTYLLAKRNGGKLMTQREICMKLVQDGMLKEIYPQLSSAAEMLRVAPISTATVERNFSTMNRILTKLRNQLTTQHVDQLMRISIEGADTLNEETKEEIINYWKKVKPRRLAV